ncbi:MaoC family dehydratase [Homoserinimonas sp. A520]
MRTIDGIDGLSALVGQELGTSPWLAIDQARIDLFADATLDSQWIHVDRERAETSDLGSTVAHGLLTLSLIPQFARQIYTVTGLSKTLNYGYNRVRFPAPVKPGDRIRNRASLISLTPSGSGVQAVISHELQLEGASRPACVAEGVTLLVVDD